MKWKDYFSKKLVFYIIRWQASTLILFPCVSLLPFGDLLNVIISNIIGALIFFPVDWFIMKRKPKKEKSEVD